MSMIGDHLNAPPSFLLVQLAFGLRESIQKPYGSTQERPMWHAVSQRRNLPLPFYHRHFVQCLTSLSLQKEEAVSSMDSITASTNENYGESPFPSRMWCADLV